MWRKPQVWLGFLVSASALYLACRSVDWQRLGDAVRGAQYLYLVPGALALLAAMAIRGARWWWLYGDRRQALSVSQAFGPLCIGYFITNTLPFRLGDVARTLFITRGGRVTIAHTVSTIAVEHVLDVLTVLGILVALFVGGRLPLPHWAIRGAVLLAAAIAGAAGVMLILAWRRQHVERWVEKLLDRTARLHTQTWLRRVVHILDGFAILQPGRPLIMVVLWSIAGWLFSALSFHFVLLAFIPNPAFTISLFVIVTATVVLLVPATPGGVGTVDWAIQQSLVLFGIDPALGLSVALSSHLMQYVVMDLAGVIALWGEAGSWSALNTQLRSVMTTGRE